MAKKWIVKREHHNSGEVQVLSEFENWYDAQKEIYRLAAKVQRDGYLSSSFQWHSDEHFEYTTRQNHHYECWIGYS